MKNYLAIAVYATAVMTAACATGVDTTRSRQITDSALASRAAALVGYDDSYLKQLTETSEKLQSSNATADRISLLFTLDELADVYTYRRVDFEKALSVNRQAQSLMNGKCCPTDDESIGPFFPRQRRAYAFVWPETAETDSEPARGRQLPGVSYIRTIFPPDFLQIVAAEDLKRVGSRIRDRQIFLDSILGTTAAIPTPSSLEEETTSSQQEIETWKHLFQETLHERPYTQALLFHERVWALKEQFDEQKWLRMVAETSQGVIAAEAGYPDIRWPDLIRVRFHAGLASLRLGQIEEGIRLFEQMLRGAAEYDKVIKTVNERILREKQENRKAAYISGVAAVAMFTVASVLAGASGAQGAQGPFGEAVGDLALAESNYRTVSSQLRLLFGQTTPGLRGVLNEHERIAFHFELGYGYERLGQRKDAIAQYKSAIQIIERQRGTIPGERKRIQFLKDKEEVYRRLIPLLLEERDLEGAFEYMERARSRAFLDLLASGRPQFGTPEESRRYQQTIRKQTEVQTLITGEGLTREEAEKTREAFTTVKETEATPSVLSSAPEFDSLTTIQVAGTKDISRAIGQGAALLTFFAGEVSTTVMLLQDGRVFGWIKPVGRAQLLARIEALRHFLQVPDYPTPERAMLEIQRLGQNLYSDLLSEAVAEVKKPVVYIVPHGPLHYLPFAAIYDGSQYLVDRFSLLTVPSGTVLTYLEKKPNPSQGQTIVFANPDLGNPRLDLPFAEQEGRAIQARRPQAVMLNRSSAMEARARQLSSKAGILHFAAHASFNEDRPLNSAVLLVPGEGEDGSLTAAEIFSLPLPGTLVVLSGCETGMGKVASGDELIGFTRAFMYAGAPQVIATLWPIDDKATSVLMENFYSQLSVLPAASALRKAQINIRRQYPHPFYWAAFTTYGHHRQLQ